MNLYSVLQAQFRAAGGRACLRMPSGETWSYDELDRCAASYSALLLDSGTRPGDRVMVQVDKSPAAVALYLGVLRCGAVFVPLNTSYTLSELEYFLADAEPAVLVRRPESADGLAAAARSAGVQQTLTLGGSPDDPLHSQVVARGADRVESQVAVREDSDLAAIVYTSGTTGRSKGAMLSHSSLISNATTLRDLWGFDSGDRLLHALPIFHVHGLFVALHVAWLARAEILFQPAFDALEIVRAMREATALMGVPTFYVRLLEQAELTRGSCAHMRLFVSGSAPLSEGTFAEFERRTGHRILERYGMSEAGMITSNPLESERIAGTVGYALPQVSVRVCDDAGCELPRGEIGVLELKGPNLFSGYWRKPELTQAEFRDDGYFISGDLASMSADGRVSIVGRAKDLIISGGYNIYPKEIELCLDELPGVAECAVIGVAHSDLGEGVVAVLVGESGVSETSLPGDEELREALERRLARYKHPRRFCWLETLPRNAMGKVQKTLLRERYRDSYR